ncbi:conserved hypothetical protein [Nostocoides japonicum T1-X7]|uniref:NTP pyrophosphohydrolase n=1 Tax=Nostocoides japonicum T1-X7 TaxID=1194083 RepID=A0A077LUX3_9MICO|nr:hypothetical protein [Tetrasphaera japonica]CCH76547.1 conserved hypothetical protein [Tetrasphaera japonica T1-X7]
MRILVVDGANVVGCVPDGWWRDRPGAAARLHEGLTRTPLPYDAVVLVLEGQARRGVPAGPDEGVTTVHATGSGDDEIVDRCRDLAADGSDVTVASADLGLLARLEPFAVTALGPRALRDRLVTEP